MMTTRKAKMGKWIANMIAKWPHFSVFLSIPLTMIMIPFILAWRIAGAFAFELVSIANQVIEGELEK